MHRRPISAGETDQRCFQREPLTPTRIYGLWPVPRAAYQLAALRQPRVLGPAGAGGSLGRAQRGAQRPSPGRRGEALSETRAPARLRGWAPPDSPHKPLAKREREAGCRVVPPRTSRSPPGAAPASPRLPDDTPLTGSRREGGVGPSRKGQIPVKHSRRGSQGIRVP